MCVQMNRKQVVEKLRENQKLRQLTVRDFAEVIGVSDIWLYRVYSGAAKPGRKVLDFMGLQEQKVTTEVYIPKKRNGKKSVDSNPQISV